MASKNYIVNNYIELSELGRGSFGIAYKAKNESTGEIVCVKKLVNQHKETENNFSEELSEALNMERLGNHNNKYFPKFYEFIYTHEFIYIVMEYVDDFIPLGGVIILTQTMDGDMQVQNFFKNVVRNLCGGVKYMHAQKIDHNDLKPDNILVNLGSDEIRIIDYGLSCYAEDCKNGIGYTPKYLDPELLKLFYRNNNINTLENGGLFKTLFGKRKHEIDFSIKEQADLWSLGCIIYELLIGETPYEAFEKTKSEKNITYVANIDVDYVKFYDYSKDPNRVVINRLLRNIGSNVNLDKLLTRELRSI